jgi:hypothetical protein
MKADFINTILCRHNNQLWPCAPAGSLVAGFWGPLTAPTLSLDGGLEADVSITKILH